VIRNHTLRDVILTGRKHRCWKTRTSASSCCRQTSYLKNNQTRKAKIKWAEKMHPLFLYSARKPEFLSQNPSSRTSPPKKKPQDSKPRDHFRRNKSFRAHTNATPSLRGRSFTTQRTKRKTGRGQLWRVLGQGPFPKGLPVSHWTRFLPPFDNSQAESWGHVSYLILDRNPHGRKLVSQFHTVPVFCRHFTILQLHRLSHDAMSGISISTSTYVDKKLVSPFHTGPSFGHHLTIPKLHWLSHDAMSAISLSTTTHMDDKLVLQFHNWTSFWPPLDNSQTPLAESWRHVSYFTLDRNPHGQQACLTVSHWTRFWLPFDNSQTPSAESWGHVSYFTLYHNPHGRQACLAVSHWTSFLTAIWNSIAWLRPGLFYTLPQPSWISSDWFHTWPMKIQWTNPVATFAWATSKHQLSWCLGNQTKGLFHTGSKYQFKGGQGFVFYASPAFTLDQLLTAISYVLNSIGFRTCLVHTLPQPRGQARLLVFTLESILHSTTTTWTRFDHFHMSNYCLPT
jgi:hypothetical protein